MLGEGIQSLASPDSGLPLSPGVTAMDTARVGDCELHVVKALRAARLPFAAGDVTAGSETELQASVLGSREDVDLPQAIEASRYYANLVRRSAAQDTPKTSLKRLQQFLEDNPARVWDNSWVRFPLRCLSQAASRVFSADLRADKTQPEGPRREDAQRFFFERRGAAGGKELWGRVPISYLLKLALAQAVEESPLATGRLKQIGRALHKNFVNDNTSPETYSFYVSAAGASGGESLGTALASETALRFLLAQLLTLFANEEFELAKNGQQATVFFSPHPPVRQKRLNEFISDAFYRELFISPCLSGWDRGEDKQRYMELCHQVISRSRLHALAKVRDAGLIGGNLVVMPTLSNTSLANNGIHVSLGSVRLLEMLRQNEGAHAGSFGAREEKWFGDLVIKIVEHFLPLLVGTYSAAPYRFGFADFHAEAVLGFLPHELDYRHLRMFWRRWKKKAEVRAFGYTISPSGYGWLDRALGWLFRMRGDFVPDYRLIDYLVAPLSTDQGPALDGSLGNLERLKQDLSQQGLYDTRMAFYTMYRQRAFHQMGFSGFEGRFYSLCPSLRDDLGPAVDLQQLVTALAVKYIAEGAVTHDDIPDDPTVESERRQFFFAAAVDVPTVFVHSETRNRFLKKILERADKVRSARKYADQWRVRVASYRQALWEILSSDGAELIESMGLRTTMTDLRERLRDPTRTAAQKLTRAICRELNTGDPMELPAMEFNQAAETYYRESLRRRHLLEGLEVLETACRQLKRESHSAAELQALQLPEPSPALFLRRMRSRLLLGCADRQELIQCILLCLLAIDVLGRHAASRIEAMKTHVCSLAPIR